MPSAAEPSLSRRAIAAGSAAAILLTISGYAAVVETALTKVRVARSGALLAALDSAPAAQLERLSDATVHNAVTAAPLDQRVMNVAMARDAKLHGGAQTPAWLAVLSRLGWRDTTTLQNRLYAVALRNQLTGVLDISDALLRRQQLIDQVTQVLPLLEIEPTLRPALVDRLAAQPGWRGVYLATSIGNLRTPQQLTGRVRLIEELARRGSITKSEVVPSINALDRAGLQSQAFALWQRVQPGVSRPLDDGQFAHASRSYDAGYDPVPFQWQMMTGEGFSVDATRDGTRTPLMIDWNGRGVPVFAQQRTSAMPGRYALDLDVPASDKADLPALSFKLICGDTATPFSAVTGDPARLRTENAVTCAFPTLQIGADVQSSAAAHQVTINRITMRRLDAAPDAN